MYGHDYLSVFTMSSLNSRLSSTLGFHLFRAFSTIADLPKRSKINNCIYDRFGDHLKAAPQQGSATAIVQTHK